jgi:hypothetical protein
MANNPNKKAMARKMTTMKSMGGNRGEKYALRKKLERTLDNFIKHGEKRSDENIWKYARLNPDSDKRIF